MTRVARLIQELQHQGIHHPAVLAAIQQTPREKFIAARQKKSAYDNKALPIDCQQTISQPYIVAIMSQTLLQYAAPGKILEIGTGSGYQTAILAQLFNHIWTIERIKTLYLKAKQILNTQFDNISFQLGDGTQGWPEAAPFAGIIVTAAAETPPPKLIEQLSPKGGVMVIPLGASHGVQKLTLIKKQSDQLTETVIEQVHFVPLISDHD